MSNTKLCYCGSTIPFKDCCQKYIDEKQKAPNALALMKSRYSAYATHAVDYLIKTTHPTQRKYYSKSEILNWAMANEWQKLEIIYVTQNVVEFKAYYIDSANRKHIHHELSNFLFEDGYWFYVNGVIY